MQIEDKRSTQLYIPDYLIGELDKAGIKVEHRYTGWSSWYNLYLKKDWFVNYFKYTWDRDVGSIFINDSPYSYYFSISKQHDYVLNLLKSIPALKNCRVILKDE